MDFDTFFAQATAGRSPFPYQHRLALEPRLPGLLTAPTGAGKTAAIVLGWLWHRRFHADPDTRCRTPRRLVYCLPMRVLVEQVERSVREWVERLGDVLGDAPPLVQVLRGGHIDQDWEEQPEREAVLIGTQDQLLSRALNRGYAMSRFKWPIHFGLLHNDAWWVLDEVQLMGPGLATSAQLEGLRARLGSFGPGGTTWMSATLRREWLETPDLGRQTVQALPARSVQPEDEDVEELRVRLHASKPLTRAEVGEPKELAAWITDEVHLPGKLTLVVVNRVERCQELARQLDRRRGEAELIVLHSRFRPAERGRAERRLREDVPAAGRIVVATQVVEAGVDISATRLVTDLAPWPSLVQRFGRCNRFGRDEDARAWWVDLRAEDDKAARPYTSAQLLTARARVEGLANARIKELPVLEDAPAFTDVPRSKDVIDLFDTDADLDGNFVDVSRFVRSNGDPQVHVFWRSVPAGEDPSPELPRPHQNELCQVPIHAFRELHAREARAWQWDPVNLRGGGRGRFAGAWARVHTNGTGSAPGFIASGQTYLVDAASGGYDLVLGFDPKARRPVPEAERSQEDERRRDQLEQPLEAAGADQRSERPEGFVLLATHLQDTRKRAREVVDALRDVLGAAGHEQAVERAAHWHDVGKAHEVFQQAIPGPERPEELLAKAPRFKRYASPGFRHELVSALAALAAGLDDLTAYLIAAHHGKVRLGLRPLAGELPERGGAPVIRGVVEGTTLPELDLGEGLRSPALRISLDVARLGRSDRGPSWSERCWRLVRSSELGPFRLAYLEALVRVADWRASAAPSAVVPAPAEVARG